MLCFFREVQDLNELDAKTSAKFSEKEKETVNLLTSLNARIREKLDQDNVRTYKVHWTSLESKSSYLKQFLNDVLELTKRQVDQHIKQLKTSSMTLNDQLYAEVLEHAIQCKQLNARFYERSNITDKVKQFVVSKNSREVLLIAGNSGTGKSSIMASLVEKIPSWCGEPCSIIICFLGTTPSSSDVMKPLLTIAQQLIKLYKLDVSLKDSSDPMELRNELQHIFTLLPPAEHLFILLDSIDQLSPEYYDCSKWLPLKYPTNVKFILSTIPQAKDSLFRDYHIANDLQNFLSFNTRLLIKLVLEESDFDDTIAEKTLMTWVAKDNRRLTEAQKGWLMTAFQFSYSEDKTPLQLSLFYDQSLNWHSYDLESDFSREFPVVEKLIWPASSDLRGSYFPTEYRIKQVINHLYSQLSKKYGHVLVQRSILYLKLSGGLTETELEDLLSLDNEVLQSVFVHYLPPLAIFRLPGTLWTRIRNDMRKYLVEKEIDGSTCICFYHRIFFPEFYQQDKSDDICEKTRLEYFSGRWNESHYEKFETTRELKKKYNLQSEIIEGTDRRVSKMLPFETREGHFNSRRINQLIHRIALSNYAHSFTIYDYNYLKVYLKSGRTIRDLMSEFRRTSMEKSILLFFLYDSVQTVLDPYPFNLAFELSCRLKLILPFIPSSDMSNIHSLYKQCQANCLLLKALPLLSAQVLNRYRLPHVKQILCGNGDLMILCDTCFLLRTLHMHIDEPSVDYTLPTGHTFTNVCNVGGTTCLISPMSFVLFRNEEVHEFRIENEADVYLTVTSPALQYLLLCQRSGKLRVLDLKSNEISLAHDLGEEPVEICIQQSNSGDTNLSLNLLRIVLKTNLIKYLIVAMDSGYDIPEGFKVTDRYSRGYKVIDAKSHETPEGYSPVALLHGTTDVHYSAKERKLLFRYFTYTFDEDDYSRTCDNLKLCQVTLTLPRQAEPLLFVSHYMDVHAPLLYVLTKNSVLIIHCCHCASESGSWRGSSNRHETGELKFKFLEIPGQYSGIQSVFTNYLLCWKNSEDSGQRGGAASLGTIDHYEWICTEVPEKKTFVHLYTLLRRIYVRGTVESIAVDEYTESVGYGEFTLYVHLKNGDIQKLRTDFCSLLYRNQQLLDDCRTWRETVDFEQDAPSGSVITWNENRMEITIWSMASSETLLHHLSRVMTVSSNKEIRNYTVLTNSLVIIDVDAEVSIYAMPQNTLLSSFTYTTSSDPPHNLQLFSLRTDTYILDGQASMLYPIDSSTYQIASPIELKIKCESLLTATDEEKTMFYVLSEDYTTLLVFENQSISYLETNLTVTSPLQITGIHSIGPHLLLQYSNKDLHLWNMRGLEEPPRFLENALLFVYNERSKRLAFLTKTESDQSSRLTTCGLTEELKGEIILERDQTCASMCFNGEGEFLFILDAPKSMLYMYQVTTGILMEKVFIDKLTAPKVLATDDQVFLCADSEMLVLNIGKRPESFIAEKEEQSVQAPTVEKEIFDELTEEKDGSILDGWIIIDESENEPGVNVMEKYVERKPRSTYSYSSPKKTVGRTSSEKRLTGSQPPRRGFVGGKLSNVRRTGAAAKKK